MKIRYFITELNQRYMTGPFPLTLEYNKRKRECMNVCECFTDGTNADYLMQC